SQRQQLWALFSRGDFAYGNRTLLRSNYDLRYRFRWKPELGLDLKFQGNRVSVPDSFDVFHWRFYGVGTHWSFGGKSFFRGQLNTGLKESYQYGKGLDVLLQMSSSKQLLYTRLVSLQLRDDLSTELFQRLDQSGDPRYDVRHKFWLTTAFMPGKRFQFGNHFKVYNHFGSDLDFSPDTLRNAFIDEIYFKTFDQKQQLSCLLRTALDLKDADNDLQFSFNTRYFRRLTPNLTCSLSSMYRFNSNYYSDYLWLDARLRIETAFFSYALELQSAGPPATVFEQDTRIWLRFVRQI
ncbi:MAG: hypothetical protein L3J79_09750, partial [Candidatus Marinimicrobia bacterium]|nr:hypothetical protein [Candidatus Neomarinimicrobiota bacterium]